MNISVDNILKAHMKVWEHMYSKHSGRHARPGMKPFMMVDEFDDWVQASNLLNELMTAKNISYIYNVSMLSQEDEVKSGTHLKATVLEFTEMICRVCAEASFPPPPQIDENGDEIPVTMTIAQRKAQPLHEKIRNALPIMMKTTCDRRFVTKWLKEPPVLDPKRNLYILENGKFF